MLDASYKPMYLYRKEFLGGLPPQAGEPFVLALERGEGEVAVHRTFVYAEGHEADNLRYAERLVKTMLWAYGGYRFYVLGGGEKLVEGLRGIYSESGARAFDVDFMTKVYLRPLEFVSVKSESEMPEECFILKRATPAAVGCRIGFDAGGSDRKVTACVDGKVVFEKETVWFPKLNADPEYHRVGIEESIDAALAALGGYVDAIGVSTAGIVVGDEVRVASLFRKVPDAIYREKVFPIYKNLAEKYGCPVKVANDGDVAALAGAFAAGKGRVLGVAMGTSLAGGYIDAELGIRGYLNELAFAPVDENPNASLDEWSGDAGVGGNYHSQDAVIRLAPEAGIILKDDLSPAEKLKEVQKLANEGDRRAQEIFLRLGDYFGYSLLWFGCFYEIDTAIFLGRVASGKGGELLLERAKEVLRSEGSSIEIVLPDEMSRRLGQSFTATQL